MRSEATWRAAQPDWDVYRREVHRFVRSRVEDHAAAEDIAQEALAKAIAELSRLRDGDKLRPWLYRITRNAIADHYRSQRPSAPLPEETGEEPHEQDPGRSLACCLPSFVERLPEGYRRAVELSAFEALTQKEAAERLGLSVSGVKSRVQRARKMLAAMLRECCHLELDGRGGLVGYEPKRPGCCRDRC